MRQPDEMLVMVRVADRGGFTAAAEDVGLTPSAVAKLVQRLETRLGARLLNRTTRRVTLTAEGQRYVSRARKILADIDECEADVMAQGAAPRGELRVACATGVGFATIVGALPRFRELYPDIRIEFAIGSRRIDIVENQIDVAIRLGALPDSSLVARKLATFRRILCASPTYLASAPRLEAPDDLLQHECLFTSSAADLDMWPFRDSGGRTRRIKVTCRYTFDDGMACYLASLVGVGIIRLSNEQAARALKVGRLVPVLEADHVSEAVQLHAVVPHGRQNSPKVRAFIDFMADAYEKEGWR
jgi:DNA-binding transcriptional LysR family regulator